MLCSGSMKIYNLRSVNDLIQLAEYEIEVAITFRACAMWFDFWYLDFESGNSTAICIVWIFFFFFFSALLWVNYSWNALNWNNQLCARIVGRHEWFAENFYRPTFDVSFRLAIRIFRMPIACPMQIYIWPTIISLNVLEMEIKPLFVLLLFIV